MDTNFPYWNPDKLEDNNIGDRQIIYHYGYLQITKQMKVVRIGETSQPIRGKLDAYHEPEEHKFKRGRTSCQDEHRSGRPNEVTTPEIVKKIHKTVLNDRRLKVRELANMVGISKSAVQRILAENLDMRKLCARWVPRLFTMEQKQRCEDVSIECLTMFHRNKAEFLRRFITMDETWVHHFTPESKEQSKQWTVRGEPAPKKAKTVPSAGKVMASVFWDVRGIIFIDYLEKGKTINDEYYANLLQRLSDKIKEKRPHLVKKKVLFHQDNAPVHTSVIAMAKIQELKRWILLGPYSTFVPATKRGNEL
ncbi:histone-lysine N-methyltransferase SETMAR-like [Colletes latitarsis]|uniref:histone-lysine N-methyltransferase SETMAR-like n=1 Tax=Colletes latitarsis TaxID=2605962 RepID=UPI0040363F49